MGTERIEKYPASEFSTSMMLWALTQKTIANQGGGLSIDYNEEKKEWHVGAEYGREAPDSPMAGAAVYGVGDTLRDALRTAGKDAGLWTEEDKGEPEQRPRRVLICEAAEESDLDMAYPLHAVQGSVSLLNDADEAYVFHGTRAVVLKTRHHPAADVHVAIQRRP